MDALQMMTEFRSVHTVVDMGTILDLVHRVCQHGQDMANCDSCKQSSQSPMVAFSALVEQCLSLFEAACSTYNITLKNAMLDADVLAFEQRLPHFVCIKSKTVLGQMELDNEESGYLVRMLLNRSLAELLEILEILRGILQLRSKETSHFPRTGATPLRVCESSVESTIHRVTMFMEQIEIESSKDLGPPFL
ncbi:hypothetical protein PHISP_03778 [Aspergillus sp. HF37]|nr:hypothetical protein PHISP_03778 [Aspergillus sp. HF37]